MSVLFYHRVADSLPNPWSMSCRKFQQQVDFCRDRFDLISLAELQRRSRMGASDRPSVTFTFDDGYAENCQFAIPLLIRHQIPCTYFVSLDHVLRARPFDHDLERGVALAVNTIDELKSMADGGIEIGLHTRDHFDFSRPVTSRQIHEQITKAAAELADRIGRPIRYFAFPYGLRKHLHPEVIDAIRDAGMDGYCSAYGAYNFPGDDPFHIRRIHADPSWAPFENWLTYDERKVRIEKRNERLAASNRRPVIARPLRVMFMVTSLPVGGAETLLVNLIDRLDPAKIEPEVVCIKDPGPLGEQIAVRHTLHSHLSRGKYDVHVLSRLTKLMRNRKVDAVITIGAGDKMFWGRIAAKLAGVPVICSALHSTGWPDGVGRLNRALTRITDAFIAVADHHGIHLSKHEGFPKEKVHIIRNGVDCTRFSPDPDARRSLRESLGLAPSSKLVGIVAALRPEKNHAMFVDVAGKISELDNDVHFLIVGDGPERGAIEKQIEELGMTHRIHLLGTRHDTDKIVAALDLFLLCSHNEASPVSILEALACEVPAISTRVGSVGESVQDGRTGFLVEKDDRQMMVKYALEILANRSVKDSLGAAGRQLVLQSGSLESMVEGYTALIEWLFEAKCGVQLAQPSGGTHSSTKSRLAASSLATEEVH